MLEESNLFKVKAFRFTKHLGILCKLAYALYMSFDVFADLWTVNGYMVCKRICCMHSFFCFIYIILQPNHIYIY